MEYLSPDQAFLLGTALNRIIPGDDFPDAVSAGVPEYIEGRITAQPELLGSYQAAILLLESRSFCALDTSAQDAVLTELEGHPSIATMVSHAIEGYYAGVDSAGAKMLGFRVTV